MRAALVLLALGVPCLLAGQDPNGSESGADHRPEGEGVADLRATIAATNGAIRAACPHPAPDDRGALLRTELERSDAPRRGRATAGEWHALGCARGLLYAADAIAREGVLMSLGDSWHKGAVRALLRGLVLEPGHLASAEVLAELALAENFPAELEQVGPAMLRAADAGVRAPMTLRACAELLRRAGNTTGAARCGELALAAGMDSTWQLVHLARLRFMAADTAGGQRLFHRAAAAAHDSAGWAPILWQLHWFLEPDEVATWAGLPDSARASWVRDRFAMRDVRDGRAPGSRMAEHFERLEVAEVSFRVDVPRREMGRFVAASDPESGLPYERVVKYWEPGLVAAAPFRFYLRRHLGYDDRAAVYMRFGIPERRLDWSRIDRERTGRDSAYQVNTREAWRYRLDGKLLLLQFEAERFDGSVEATRLVAGVLGSYLCGVDQYRCNLTERSATPGFSALNPETAGTLRLSDEEHIREATTKDDNSVRVAHPIATVATLARVWDPRSGAALAVIPYAVKVGDVARDEDSTGVTAMIALTLRQWDGTAGSWQETDAIRRLRLPARLRNNSHLTGYLVTPTTAGTSAWSLVAAQGADRRGRAWQTDAPPLDAGPLVLSDLILGAASQGQTWITTSGTSVPLAPLGAFDKREPVSLYWQVRSAVARDSVRVRVALFREEARGEREELALEFTERVGAGLTEVSRVIGIDRLDRGSYRLEVTLRDPATGHEARRSARLLVD